MSDGPVLGIDLGTTNSVVAIADGGQARVLTDADGRRMIPSVVSFADNGETIVGFDARERRLIDAENTVYAVKRLLGRPFDSPEVARAKERFAFQIVPNKHGGAVVKVDRGTYALAEISAIVLRELRRIAEETLGEPCERAVITVPANFNELQRSATKAAGKVAGLEVLRILNEPTAAALAYGYGAGGGSQRIAVYDLGGGTFDITILELEDDVFEVLSTAGDTFLGGEDVDRMIAERMCDAFRAAHGIDPRGDAQAFERLKAAGEWAKCQLSTEDAVELTVEELLPDAQGRPLDLRFTMTQPELDALALPWLRRSFAVCDEALRGAGVRPSELSGVVLVGGSTRLPLCRRMVREYFGKEPRGDIDPDMVVAQGAAIHGYALGGSKLPRSTQEILGVPKKRTTTAAGIVPRQPAFAPAEQLPTAPKPQPRPARATRPPPLVPDLPIPPPAVQVSPAVAVRAPRTTVDSALDDLAPPEEGSGPDPLAGIAPVPGKLASREPTIPFAHERPSPTFGELEPPSERHAIPFAKELEPPSQKHAIPFGDLEPPSQKHAIPFGDLEPPSQKHVAPAISRFELEPDLPIYMAIPETPAAPQPHDRSPVQSFAIGATQPIVSMPERSPPLLLDVTPHSLGVETAGGYCRRIIAKNAPVPTEQMGTFTTAKDDQGVVAVRVCQGEEEHFEKNQVLGEVVLDQLPLRARGALSIEVTFILDADGTLAVEARDAESGRVQRTHIHLRGGLKEDEIAAMRARQEGELR